MVDEKLVEEPHADRKVTRGGVLKGCQEVGFVCLCRMDATRHLQGELNTLTIIRLVMLLSRINLFIADRYNNAGLYRSGSTVSSFYSFLPYFRYCVVNTMTYRPVNEGRRGIRHLVHLFI